MTKADIVERIHQKIGLSKKESAEMVEMVFGIRPAAGRLNNCSMPPSPTSSFAITPRASLVTS